MALPTELTDRVTQIMDVCSDLIVRAVEDVDEDLIPGEILYDHFPQVYDKGTAEEIDELEGEFRSLLELGKGLFLLMVARYDPQSR